VNPRQSKSQFLAHSFACAWEIWKVGVVYLVVLACVLRKKVHPRENPGYAYAVRRLLDVTVWVACDRWTTVGWPHKMMQMIEQVSLQWEED